MAPAEVALTTIAKSALQLFSFLAKDEFLLLWKSEKELKRLKDSIETTSCLLHDADALQSKGEAVQNCVARLRNFMYDAEDFFDGLSWRVLHKKTMDDSVVFPKEVRLFFSQSNQVSFVFKTAHRVKSLRQSLDAIAKDMNMCGFRLPELSPVANQQVMRYDRDKTHSYVPGEVVIGRDQDRDRIINMLLPPQDQGETSFDDRSFSVVAVIGFGGLGKTTLAQYVYNDERVEQGFDVRLWACINYLSNLEKVLIEIIASKEGRLDGDGLEKLQQKLREIIGGKKFLVVIDDVWEEDPRKWQKLENILRCGRLGSKVLVTTRSQRVARCLDAPESCCVDLEGLSEESAWSLFVKMAFRQGELIEHPELETLGREIVDRCGNVPLAVVVIGSLLRLREREGRVWLDFLSNELGKALSHTGAQDRITDVLMVSYNDLPPNLKLCFAYCSLFPKDFEFDKGQLVRLWISQGFIAPRSGDGQSLEEVGEIYFFHLVERCFFQEVKECERRYNCASNYLYGHTAKMHDLLHDVALDVSKTESILVDKVPINKGNTESLRHISIRGRVDDSFDYCGLVSDPKAVRTLLIHSEFRRSNNSLNLLLPRFRKLRTLELSNLGIDRIPESIGELSHLRYLDLSSNGLLKLPRSICKLHQLMILILEYCRHLGELPPEIEKLVSLRQLYVEGCYGLKSLPSGLAALTSLYNLDRLIVHHQSGGLRYLNGLDNLHGVLTIGLPKEGWPDAIEDAKRANMLRKDKLQGMVVRGNNRISEQTMAKDEEKSVMEALEPHKKLEYLKILEYGGESLPGWFCTLKNVKVLSLGEHHHVEYLVNEFNCDTFFSSLQTLDLWGMYCLKGWWRQEIPEETQLPCLGKCSKVYIRSCPNLKEKMPLFVGIESLELYDVDVKLVMHLLNVDPRCSQLSSLATFYNNNKLKKLHLDRIEGLTCVPEGWIRHLTALQVLRIENCCLSWVSCRGLSRLSALKQLRFSPGKICDDDDEQKIEKEAGMPWKALHNLHSLTIGFDLVEKCYLSKVGIQYLHSLRSLNIQYCKELHVGWKTLLIDMKLKMLRLDNVESVIDVDDTVVEQPTQLDSLYICSTEAKWLHGIPWNSLASLRTLYLSRIGGMEQLPDGIQHLTSLQELRLLHCCSLRSVPNWIPQLTSLRWLELYRCPEELKKRCEKERGEDWHLIRHIPDINIYSRDVESENKEPEKIGWCGLFK